MLIRLVFTLLLSTVLSAQAGVLLRGARVIYDEIHGEATAHLRYVGDTPALVQIWMEAAIPGEQTLPFVLTPAVLRMDPDQGQSVRILRTREGLPQDRESLFYFNTREVPPTPTAQISRGDPFLQLSLRSRFKLFYRPKGLRVPPARAIEMLRFAITPPGINDARWRLKVHNLSPYHVTFAEVYLRHAGADADSEPVLGLAADVRPDERMVAPMGELLLPLDGGGGQLPASPDLPPGLEVDYTIINDVGGRPSRRQRIG